MANLIITVISIALVAVAALMSAYFGGAAFIDGQAKARANTLVSHAEQLAAAARLWSANNAGRTDAFGPLNGGTCSFHPNNCPGYACAQPYLNQVPSQSWHTGMGVYSWSWLYANGQSSCSGQGGSLIGGNVLVTQIYSTDLSSIDKVCKFVNDAVGAPYPVAYVYPTQDFATPLANYPYLCVKGTNVDTRLNYFVYRVF